MTKAIILAIVLLIAAIFVVIYTIRSGKSFDDKLGFVMIAAIALTCSIGLFGIREFPAEKLERAKVCLQNGYDLVLDEREVSASSLIEYLDKYVILQINDNDGIVYIRSTDESPFTMD